MVAMAPFDLLCDDLVLAIFNMLGFEEKLHTMPLVCRRWRNLLSNNPSCWQTVDLSTIICKRAFRHQGGGERAFLDLLQRLATLSGGRPRELIAPRIGAHSLSFFIDRSICPQATLPTTLEIAFCYLLTHVGIEAFGQHCQSLSCLTVSLYSHKQCEAIAQHMHQLTYLQVAGAAEVFFEKGLFVILERCTNLEVLAVSGARFIFEFKTADQKARECLLKLLKEFHLMVSTAGSLTV